jgi:UDP-3-O-[3-hydroxymyristoyl] glucosamine N-acyltransferase
MRNIFFRKKTEFLTLKKIIEITGSELIGNFDLDKKIYDIATLKNAKENEISFLHSIQYLDQFQVSKAGFCFIEKKYIEKAKNSAVLLIHENPYFANCQILESFYEEKKSEIVEERNIHETAKIGDGTKISNGAFIGKNVVIGNNCFIGVNSVILDGSIIGNDCVINSNCVISFAKIGNNCIFHHGVKIGQDGFGFVHHAGKNYKIIQIGIVEIGNNVEIGANSCVDRGAIENTIIADDVKIDNLVQIAHNVKIGKGTFIAGCAAIAGSAEIGQFVQIGGACCINGHIKIGDGVKIAGMSGVMRDVENMQIIGGAPALPIKQWHKLNAKLIAMVTKKTYNE